MPNMELMYGEYITMHAFSIETYCVHVRCESTVVRRLACLMGCVTLPEA